MTLRNVVADGKNAKCGCGGEKTRNAVADGHRARPCTSVRGIPVGWAHGNIKNEKRATPERATPRYDDVSAVNPYFFVNSHLA